MMTIDSRRMPEITPQRRSTGTRACGYALALAAAVVLASCGGSSSSSVSTNPGGGGGAAAFYVSGLAGVQRNSASNLPLIAVNPNGATQATIPSASLFTGTQATFAQWSASAGNATGTGIRYRVWAGSDNNLYNTDLLTVSGAATPTTNQLSTFSLTSVCAGATPTALTDYANPGNSLLVFHNSSAGCGGLTDQFTVVPLSATAATAPAAAST